MMEEFERKIKDSNLSAAMDLSYKNRPLLIAFGGIYGTLGYPPFEFFNLTKNLNVNKIYLRDHSQTWYHSGLSGISKSIDQTAHFLRRKIDEALVSKVIVIGNSMGGYAAILFGILLKADIVHAFSPHTFIHNEKYIRSKEQIRNVHNNFSNEYFDLGRVIKTHNNIGELNIYYDSKNKRDKKHAMHLKRIQNITFHSFSGGGHRLIKLLKESGELNDIILSALNGDASKKTVSSDSKKRRSFLSKLFSTR